MKPDTEIFATHEVVRAAQILRKGGVLAFATETVYGLGADARNGAAVAAIFAAKGRPAFNPLIVHVADLAAAEQCAEFSPLARRLAAAFWPGPLSLVLPLRRGAGLSSLVSAGLDTVAIRLPAHQGALDLLTEFGGPVAAPSANPSGAISPTRVDHVLAGLSGRIDGVLDGGNCTIGLESTILMVSGQVSLLRAGGIAVEDIEAVLGGPVGHSEDQKTPKSPGQLASHYAPNAALRVNVHTPREDEVYIGFGEFGPANNADMSLSAQGDLVEAAANLFAVLRDADGRAAHLGKTLAVAPVPRHGLGLAINDRLMRASGARS